MFSNLFGQASGPILVASAALLWATDALVRYPAAGKVSPVFIVLIEHILAVLVLFPWLYKKGLKFTFSLDFKEWLSAFLSGVGGSALATLLFTASFRYVNPSVSVLLQKFQPLIVVLIAYAFLNERPAKKFYFWSLIALLAGIVLSFPEFNFKSLFKGVTLYSKGIQYSLIAAFLWAASTVAGKILLKRTHPTLATFWRFFFGGLALSVIQGFDSHPQNLSILNEAPIIASLLYLSLVPGLLAVLVYYQGLSKTSASVTTFIELVYPIGAVLLNTLFLNTPLETVQTIAGSILILAVAMISF